MTMALPSKQNRTPGFNRIAPATAPLAALAVRFDQCLRLERAADRAARAGGDGIAWEAASASTGAVVREILAAPASSLDDLKIKAAAIQWCHGGRFSGFDDADCTDQLLAASIVKDLLAMARRS